MTVETDLSDFHKMTVTVLKKHFKKKDPIIITYRDLKLFDGLKFREEIKNQLEQSEKLNVTDFKSIFVSTWNSHAPVKKKVVRDNNAPFMNRTLSKAFMHRSKLKNRYHKFSTEANKNVYKKHRNFCVSLLKKEKKKYYNNLDMKVIENNKTFWKSIKPLFSGKCKSKRNITLVENGQMVAEKREVAETLNNYFSEAVQRLEIKKFNSKDEQEIQTENTDDVIENILEKYKTHPSILKIKESVKVDIKFKFDNTTEDYIYSKIKSLGQKKLAGKMIFRQKY